MKKNKWRFFAYKTEEDYNNSNPYFIKEFDDHTELKVFSGKHSAQEKIVYRQYCSTYKKLKQL
jgi:hypothetical protein